MNRVERNLCASLAILALAACGGSSGGGNPKQSKSGCEGAGGWGGTGAEMGGSGGTGGMAVSDSAKPECTGENGSGDIPQPRSDTAGVLSADGKEMLVFGGDTANVGCNDIPSSTPVGDTWILDTACGGWTSLPADDTGTTAPLARARHSMALDASRNRALLFGGRSGASGAYLNFNDVWAFDFAGHTWTKLTTTGTGPGKRSNAGAVVLGDQLIVMGGNASTDGLVFAPLGDIFSLDLTTNVWTRLSVSGGPAPRLFHAIAGDADKGLVYVFSGGDANAFLGPFLRDVWAFDLAQKAWSKLPIPDPGLGRIKFGMSFLPASDGRPEQLVVFGGHDDGVVGNRNDVMAVDLTHPVRGFDEVIPGDVFHEAPTGPCDFPVHFTDPDLASPERRSGFAFGRSVNGKSFVVVGGDSDCGILDDAWWYDAVARSWTPIRTSLSGLICLRTGAVGCSSMCN